MHLALPCSVSRRAVSRMFVTVALLAAAPAAQASNVLNGWGTVVATDVLHPNRNIYDQVLMTGPHVTIAAHPQQVVRLSFLDPNHDIVQVEFSGSGSITVELDAATYVPPAPPQRYFQPGINYVQGRATIRVRNPDATTHLSVFSVGRNNAVNQTLFPEGMTYDAWADVALLDVEGAELGGIHAGNARFGGPAGAVGIQAPGTLIRQRLVVGEIEAQAEALPLLRIGAGSPLERDGGAVLVAGGDLQSSNGSPIDASSAGGTALAALNFVAGTRSDGTVMPAATLPPEFATRLPGQIWVNGAARSTRGYVPTNFDQLLAEVGYDAFDFGDGTTLQFSGGNQGSYTMTMSVIVDGELVNAQLKGGYVYSVSGTHHSTMTFSMTLSTVWLSWAGGSFNGTVQQLATLSGEAFPTRITAVASFESLVAGTASMTVLFTNGTQQTDTATFDEDTGLDFGFL